MKRNKHSQHHEEDPPAKTAGMLFGLIFGAGLGMFLGALYLNNPTNGIAVGAGLGLLLGLAAGFAIEMRLRSGSQKPRNNSGRD